MNRCYLIPVIASDVYVKDYSLLEMTNIINPHFRNDKESMSDLCYLSDVGSIPKKLVAFFDGKVLYEAETTMHLKCSDDIREKYRADPIETLEVLVKNEDYSEQAANFFKEGKIKEKTFTK